MNTLPIIYALLVWQPFEVNLKTVYFRDSFKFGWRLYSALAQYGLEHLSLCVNCAVDLCLPAFHAVRALIRNFASGEGEALNEINMMFFAVKNITGSSRCQKPRSILASHWVFGLSLISSLQLTADSNKNPKSLSVGPLIDYLSAQILGNSGLRWLGTMMSWFKGGITRWTCNRRLCRFSCFSCPQCMCYPAK